MRADSGALWSFCCGSCLTSLPLSQAALVAQVNLSLLVFPGWDQISGQIKANAEMSSDIMRIVLVQAGEGSQHQPMAQWTHVFKKRIRKARKQHI